MVFLHKPNKDQFDPEFDTWFGKISHDRGTEPCTTTIEPALESLRAATTDARVPYSLRSSTRDATAVRSLCITAREYPCSPQLEKALVQKRRKFQHKQN